MANESALGLSDEEMLNLPDPEDELEVEAVPAVEEQAIVENEDEPEVLTEEEEDPDAKDLTEGTDDADLDGEQTTDLPDTDADKDVTEELVDDKAEDEVSSEVDSKKELERLYAPFKANGKDMQIDSVDDAINLMKMGANYNKKMAGLKPALKIVKMLENNGLMDETALSYLIDLHKKNPEAISKLLKDSGTDPLDIDLEKATEYKPSTYNVNDSEMELDAVLDDIRDTPAFKDTIDIISNKWDESSKKVLFSTPSLIKTINEHVEAGIYETVSKVVERERMLGRLSGLSDLDAYRQVGDAIQANGGFGQPPEVTPKANVEVKPVVKPSIDPKLISRKKAASTTKGTVSSKPLDSYNPLSLSDDEFENSATSKYL